jgi:hypothetical protein
MHAGYGTCRALTSRQKTTNAEEPPLGLALRRPEASVEVTAYMLGRN